MTQSVSEVLDRAADLLESEGRWTQGALARTKMGHCIGPEEANSACWCALGAIMHVGKGLNLQPVIIAMRTITGGSAIGDWNDAPGRTQDEVVQALRSASQQAKAHTQREPS